MRFKLDENLPAEAADLLREAGHDAATVLEQEMSGETDPNVGPALKRAAGSRAADRPLVN